MDELIYKKDAIKAICEDGTWLERQGCTEITMAERKQRDADILSELPPVQPKRGKWMRKRDGVYCSACYKGWDFMTGVPAEVETEYKFCPHCGADMRGNADDEVGS